MTRTIRTNGPRGVHFLPRPLPRRQHANAVPPVPLSNARSTRPQPHLARPQTSLDQRSTPGSCPCALDQHTSAPPGAAKGQNVTATEETASTRVFVTLREMTG